MNAKYLRSAQEEFQVFQAQLRLSKLFCSGSRPLMFGCVGESTLLDKYIAQSHRANVGLCNNSVDAKRWLFALWLAVACLPTFLMTPQKESHSLNLPTVCFSNRLMRKIVLSWVVLANWTVEPVLETRGENITVHLFFFFFFFKYLISPIAVLFV